MASETRVVQTMFWDDDYIGKLSALERYLFLYILTNPKTNYSGVYQLPRKYLSIDTSLENDFIDATLAKFEKDGKMKYEGGWIAVRNWMKHQKATGYPILKHIAEQMKKAPKWCIDYIGYQYPLDIKDNIREGKVSKDKGSKETSKDVVQSEMPIDEEIISVIESDPAPEEKDISKDISFILALIREKTKIEKWEENRQSERAQGKNLLALYSEIGEKEFLKRLASTAKEMHTASFSYLYGKMSAFVDKNAVARKKRASDEKTSEEIENEARKKNEAAYQLLKDKFDLLPEEEKQQMQSDAERGISALKLTKETPGYEKALEGFILASVRRKYPIENP